MRLATAFQDSIIALVVAAILAVFMTLPGCSMPAGNSASSLGPEAVIVAQDASTLSTRIKAGVAWLWSSYAALKAKGYAIPAMEDLRETILDIEAVADKGDLTAALDLYMRARALVTQIVTVVS